MNKQQPTVMKFGGTSVRGSEAFGRAAEIISAEKGNRPVVVVSAMAGFTDLLLEAFEIAKSETAEVAFGSLTEMIEKHASVSREQLSGEEKEGFDGELSLAREDVRALLKRVERRSLPLRMLRDAIASYGEQLSARLVADISKHRGLSARYIDARRLIVTDDEYGSAAPVWDDSERFIRLELESVLEKNEIPVFGGYIASSRAGETTTLGRGGSDYTAALVGAALGACEIQIWTDVTGVLTCDPRICKKARTVETLSYAEAAELAYFGAKVLHPKTIQPAVDHGVPVRVCNSKRPGEKGTMIVAEGAGPGNGVKAIAHKTGVTVLRISSARMLGSYGFMSALFQIFERFRTVIDVISTSEVSVALTLDDTGSLDSIVNELERLGDLSVERGFAVVCVVGEGLRESRGLAASIFSTIRETRISLISHGASSVNLTFVVSEAEVSKVIRKLHRSFFEV